MKRYKEGDRVSDPALGEGTVVSSGHPRWPRHWCLVEWDNTPGVRYNMRQNPTLWWPGCHGEEATP